VVAINFMRHFEPLILSGTKVHTLRDKPRADVGDTLQLYTGQRTKKCRLIKQVTCTVVVPVEYWAGGTSWCVDNRHFPANSLDQLAVGDGFSDFKEMLHWFMFNKGPQWSGYLIAWGSAPYLPTTKE